MTTPADEIRAAADQLEPLADKAQADLENDDYWKCYDPNTAWWDGLTNGMGGASGDLAGAISPAAVKELARWLRAEARRASCASSVEGQAVVSAHALAFARAINGGEQP
ncbi:hypothetical protein [Streptomyces sp. NPDC059786]|uniref:hypothetical protein n=1 Tax=Streptomyces sp. NPDC059786 TaxID=3346946 RepID=UPI003657FDC5